MADVFDVVWMLVVLVLLFACLVSEKVAPDLSMVFALTLCICGGLISVEEAVAGFSNEGLLTVMSLYVVASGVSHTGGLDWYMSKMLGKPKLLFVAQLRLMLPVAAASALFNNTPLVAIMIPIVQSWARKIGFSKTQLLMQLSFASILGGTMTIIGTSTNLVVVGLLGERYPNEYSEDPITIGLFDVGLYGFPVALVGFAYIVALSPLLLPMESGGSLTNRKGGGTEDILVSARVMRWSPACDNTVGDSGLRGLPGLYLVTVHKQSTGATLRAVGPDLILQEGDRLDFTGVVESFGRVCNEYGLEAITNETENEETEIDATLELPDDDSSAPNPDSGQLETVEALDASLGAVKQDWGMMGFGGSAYTSDGEEENKDGTEGGDEQLQEGSWTANLPGSPLSGFSQEKAKASPANSISDMTAQARLQAIRTIRDLVREESRIESLESPTSDSPIHTPPKQRPARKRSVGGGGGGAFAPLELLDSLAPATVVVVPDPSTSKKNVVFIGINSSDRPGLVHDISKGLKRLSLQALSSEASVVGLRSISLWRCEVGGGLRAERRRREGVDETDIQEIWSVLTALLEYSTGADAIKQRGLRVIRASIPAGSGLVGKTADESNFREKYRSAIVAIQRSGGNPPGSLKGTRFDAKDILILQVGEDSVLLTAEFARALKRVEARGSTTPTNKLKRNSTSFDKLRAAFTDFHDEEPAEATEYDDEGQVKIEMKISGSVGASLAALETPTGGDELEMLACDLKILSNIQPTIAESSAEDDNETDDDKSQEGGAIPGEEDMVVGREFLAAYYVKAGTSRNSPLIGKNVKEAGIASLPGLFLVSIERPVADHYNDVVRQREASAVGSPVSFKTGAKITISVEEKLQADDILWWSGDGAGIGNLRKIPGLSPFENSQLKKLGKGKDRRLVQAVIARTGPLVGKTIKDLKFRTRFNCAVIAVNREGTRVQQHIGGITLSAGDVLLLEAGPNFVKDNAENARCFALLSEIEDSTPPRMKLLIPSLILTLAMLIVYTFGVVSLLVAALCASVAMVACGVLTQSEARDAVNWEIFVTIASAFGIGTAMVNSGVASAMASFLVRVGTNLGLGSTGLFAMVYLATVLISNVVTNNAAAALIFPVAMDAAEQGNVSLMNMAFCIMLAASASFMTPFGYQTNLMVYGPGSYKTVDFLRFGTPMQIVLWLWSIILLGVGDSRGSNIVFVFWVIAAGILVVVVLFCVVTQSEGVRGGGANKTSSKVITQKKVQVDNLPALQDRRPSIDSHRK